MSLSLKYFSVNFLENQFCLFFYNSISEPGLRRSSVVNLTARRSDGGAFGPKTGTVVGVILQTEAYKNSPRRADLDVQEGSYAAITFTWKRRFYSSVYDSLQPELMAIRRRESDTLELPPRPSCCARHR